jgi:hypothetical protein
LPGGANASLEWRGREGATNQDKTEDSCCFA